jgi:glucokinase
MAILLQREGGKWWVLPGEGGHVGFAPQSDDEIKIWQALHAQHGRVSTERVVSGPGLANIHRILTGQQASPAAITRLALSDDNLAARRSLDIFLAAYGAFAGDMAMLAMARGGVFLAGGIAPKLLPLFPQSPFLSSFNGKGAHVALAQRMPVTVVTDAVLGLRGAALLACGA